MKIFLDTNVLLDVLLDRKPFYADSAAVWTLAERRTIEGLISAISFNNVYYVVRRLADRTRARRAVRLLSATFATVACDESVLREASDSNFDDFEDAIQYVSAMQSQAECFVTRNPGHFPDDDDFPILTPDEFLATREWE